MLRSLENIANDIINELKTIDSFKFVDKAAVSSGEQLMKRLASCSPLPAAIVCLGAADSDQHGIVRKLTAAICVVGKPGSTEAGHADSIWPLVEAVEALFLPSIDAEGNISFPEIETVHYEPKGWTPIDDPRLRAPAFAVELELTDHIGI